MTDDELYRAKGAICDFRRERVKPAERAYVLNSINIAANSMKDQGKSNGEIIQYLMLDYDCPFHKLPSDLMRSYGEYLTRLGTTDDV